MKNAYVIVNDKQQFWAQGGWRDEYPDACPLSFPNAVRTARVIIRAGRAACLVIKGNYGTDCEEIHVVDSSGTVRRM